MMFLLRGVLVSTAVFVLLYVGASALVVCTWRRFLSVSHFRPDSAPSGLLFSIRMAPLALGAIAVAAFEIPSFIRFEPRNTEEGTGAVLVFLALIFLLLVGSALVRTITALNNMSRCVRRWSRGACSQQNSLRVVTASPEAPPVALAGVASPRLLISQRVASSLSQAELQCTIAHELAHLNARDNLKKLVLHAFSFPGMSVLERRWRDAIELAADSKAVHSEAEALDLASALIKVARLTGAATVPNVASGLVDRSRSILQERVNRLTAWRVQAPACACSPVPIGAALIAVGVLVCNYWALLRGVHAMTEFLVR